MPLFEDSEKFEQFTEELINLLQKYSQNPDAVVLTYLNIENNEQTGAEEKKLEFMFLNANSSFPHMQTISIIDETRKQIFEAFKDKIEREEISFDLLKKIENGFFVVCIDDSNKPDDFSGQWIKREKVYQVIDFCFDILSTKNDVAFKLKDVESEEPYKFFKGNRFKPFSPRLN